MTDDAETTPDEPENSTKLKVALGVTVAFVLLYGAGLAVMFASAEGAKDPTWTRWIYLLSGLEAVVFAAVGWLFGSEVNRARAASAEKDAKTAKQDASQAKGEADAAKDDAHAAATEAARLEEAGSQLRRAIEAQAASAGAAGDQLGQASANVGPPSSGVPARSASDADLVGLLALARRFPE